MNRRLALNRRDFLKLSAGGASAAMFAPSLFRVRAQEGVTLRERHPDVIRQS